MVKRQGNLIFTPVLIRTPLPIVAPNSLSIETFIDDIGSQ
jgi:hypothetical protein